MFLYLSYLLGPTTVVVTQPHTTVITSTAVLGECSGQTTCPNCHAQVMTNLTYQSGLLTWLLCGAIFLFG